nr:NlpC/P60 family protein [Rhodohalobacter sp. SW132]
MCTPGNIVLFYQKFALLLLTVILLSSCGVANQQRAPQQSATDSGQRSSILGALEEAHREWQGTPYILGGSGINGVDCSSFTQIIFRDYLGKTLPRNTRAQLQEGNSVRRNQIQPGDLIFFRTGRDLLHVGIAMENGRFLHASVSSGVMISRLDQNYWASRYLATRRLF